MRSKAGGPKADKVWLVTGASRGIGLQIVLAALSSGDYVVAGARSEKALRSEIGVNPRLLTTTLDVTNRHDISTAVRKAQDEFGRVDVLVNNAGYGQLGAFEEQSERAIEAQFATNVFGAFNVTKAVLPMMRKQRAGHIISISSISGIAGCGMASVYCASKYALTGWSDSLGKELAPFGISVSTVYPGTFKTDFFGASSARTADQLIDDYVDANKHWVEVCTDPRNEPLGDPQALGRLVVLLAAYEKPPSHIPAGSDAVSLFQSQGALMRDAARNWRTLSIETDAGSHGDTSWL